MTYRLFIAFPLPPEATRLLGERIIAFKEHPAVRRDPRAVKWVEPKNIHLTAKFLGDTPSEKVGVIKSAIDSSLVVAPPVWPLSLQIDRLGAFPNSKSPSIIWAGLSGTDSPRLGAIVATVDASLAEVGFEPERRGFRPHLTLGRVREGSDTSGLAEAMLKIHLAPFECPISSLVLYRSELLPAGPRYTPLAAWR